MMKGEENAEPEIHMRASRADGNSDFIGDSVERFRSVDMGIPDSGVLLAIQRDLSVGLFKCRFPEDCLILLYSCVVRIPHVDAVGVCLNDARIGRFRPLGHQGLTEDFFRMISDQVLYGSRMRPESGARLVVSNEGDVSAEMKAALESGAISHAFAIPLWDCDHMMATLAVAFRGAVPAALQPGGFLDGFVEQVEAAIKSIRAREDFESQLLERAGAAEKALAASTDKRANHELATPVLDENYRRLHESMMDAFVRVDMEGRIRECNRSFEALVGYSRDELMGGRIHDFTPDRWHAQDREIFGTQTLTRGCSEIYEKQYVRKDGTFVFVEVRACLLRDENEHPCGMWEIVRDISARKEFEMAMREWSSELERRVSERTAELSQSEERFRKLAEVSFEGIAISENGILWDGNAQLARMFGYELLEMIGRPVLGFVAPQSRVEVGDRIESGAEGSCDHYGVRKDGTVIPLEVHARMLTWQGRVIRVTALRDVSEVKRISMELEAQRSELENARSLAMIGEISAGVIHQISQPLSAMALNVAVAKGVARKCTMGICGNLEFLYDLESDVGRLRDAVRHLYAMADPKQRNFAPLDFNELSKEVIHSLAREAENRGVTVEVEWGEGIPFLMGDAVLLRQVLLNLFRNAFDACQSRPEGEREVRVRTSGADDHGVELFVRDTGGGIAEESHELLFAPFFTTKSEGLGIGLRLAQSIIRIHGGCIEGDNNTDGPGAWFRIFLPV